MTDFTLDARLADDSLPFLHTDRCLARVMRDARFPWVILVPRRAQLADLIDLNPNDEAFVMAAQRQLAEAMRRATGCDKLNIASLGNQVRQLHIHIIARFEGDAAWPGPVWGAGDAAPMDALPAWALVVKEQLVAQGWTAS